MNIILIQWEGRMSLIKTIFVRKDREASLTYFGVPYRTGMQTPRLDEFTSERQVTRKTSPSREVSGLDSQHLERQALREPSQDRYNNQRSENKIVMRGPKIQNLQGTFKGKPT